jgi:exosome complex component RRP4
MPITILSPAPVPARPTSAAPPHPLEMDSDSDSESGGADIQGDVNMRAPKRRRASLEDDGRDDILTPGSVITANPQWMR